MIKFTFPYSPFKKVNVKDMEAELAQNHQVVQTGDFFQCIEPSIRPKDMDAFRCIMSYDVDPLVMNIIFTAGLGTRNNIIIDAETGQPIPYGNKLMVFPINSLAVTPNSDLINFDPIFNLRIMEIVLSVWIQREAAYAERDSDKIVSFYLNQTPNGLRQAIAKYANAKTICSAPYVNETSAYIDLLFVLEESIQFMRPMIVGCDQYLTNVKMMKGRRYE